VAILAGIDEAGFGPLLGPLVVSGVAFRVQSAALDGCLWDVLKATCAGTPERCGRRLLIVESKKLYRGRTGLAPLERAALVMLAVGGHRPGSWRSLLDLVAADATEELDRCLWYADADVPLPLSDGIGDIGTQANAIRRDCSEHGIELVGVFSETLLAGQYNRLVHKTRNKAVVLQGLALRVVARILRDVADQRVRLYVDRLGGRIRYRESLSTALAACDLQILEESPERSAYRFVLERGRRSSRPPGRPRFQRPTGTSAATPMRVCEIEFVTAGDSRHFPVALASIYSKYLRELYMHVFNRYWSGKMGKLRPTAGYYSDARRWLGEAAPMLDRLSIDRGMLVRQR
jgi:hypothetical protein